MLEIDERALGPQALPQLVPRDDIARPLEQEPQDFERLLLQAHTHGAVPQLARAHVQLERPETKGVGSLHVLGPDPRSLDP